MSSGWGLNGGTSRCFPFYQDFVKCMVLLVAFLTDISFYLYFNCQKDGEDPIRECGLLRDDFLECLHHRKEVFYFLILFVVLDSK